MPADHPMSAGLDDKIAQWLYDLRVENYRIIITGDE
jgi:hypothetical protein